MTTEQINEQVNPEKTSKVKSEKDGIQLDLTNPIASIGKTFSENMPKAQEYTTPELDPAIYDLKDGKPRLNKYGKPAKKPGRPKKHYQKIAGREKFTQKILTEDELKKKAEDKQAKDTQNKQYSKATAILCVDMTINGAITLFGDEWKPEHDGERDMLVDATARYFEASGVTDIPPGVALAMVVAAYALPRATKPKTLTKLQKIKLFLTQKYNEIFKKTKAIPSRLEVEAATKQ
jgi:hypothetical protein